MLLNGLLFYNSYLLLFVICNELMGLFWCNFKNTHEKDKNTSKQKFIIKKG